ncbi:MAG: hypothetical protein U0517_02725 [Candidatus Andersenbacteria bacterium]
MAFLDYVVRRHRSLPNLIDIDKETRLDKDAVIRLINDNRRVKHGDLIVLGPIVFILLLTLLTGYAPSYGLSCWGTTGLVLWLYCWYTTPDPATQDLLRGRRPRSADRLRYLLDRWLAVVDRNVLARRLWLCTDGNLIQIAVLKWYERTEAETALVWPLGGWLVRARLVSKYGRLDALRVKKCEIDPSVGTIRVVLKATSCEPVFEDFRLALAFLHRARKGETAWQTYERFVNPDIEAVPCLIQDELAALRGPTPRNLRPSSETE